MRMDNQYYKDYVVFDIETTGFNRISDSITELAAVRVRDQQIVDEFSTLVKPFKPIPDEVVKLTNITNEMVKDAPPLYKALRSFMDFIGNDILVGHNIKAFDLSFIKNKIELCVNKGYLDEKYRIQFNDIVFADSLLMARQQYPEKSHKLGELAASFGIDPKGAHRALYDVKMNQQVYEYMSAAANKEVAAESKLSENGRDAKGSIGIARYTYGGSLDTINVENTPACDVPLDTINVENTPACNDHPSSGEIRITKFSNVQRDEYDETIAIVQSMKSRSDWIMQNKILAPSKELYHWYLEQKENNAWDQKKFDREYVPRFIEELAKNEAAQNTLERLCQKQKDGKRIALLCFCPEETLCHRSIVAGILQGMGANIKTDTYGANYMKYYDMYQRCRMQLKKSMTTADPKEDDRFFCIVAGSSSFDNYDLLRHKMDHMLQNQNKVVIVTGDSKGADQLAQRYAEERGYGLVKEKVQWYKYGKKAGYIANEHMHKYVSRQADRGCVLFWDGKSKGTKDHIDRAKRYDIPVCVIDYPKILEKMQQKEEELER